MENSPEFKVVGFLDDNSELHRQVLLGKNIYSSSNLEKLISRKDVSIVFLALTAISRNKRNQIIEKLSKYKLIVKTLPSISEILFSDGSHIIFVLASDDPGKIFSDQYL